MANVSEPLYAAIDLKSFYASVECVERGLDPLTTNLVVADPTRTEKTICLAVSPPLKARGISGRARLFEVEQRIKEIRNNTGEVVTYIQAPPRMALYTRYSAQIYSIYLKYVSPEDIHPYSIDEVFINIAPYIKLYHMTAHELVTTMIRDVLHETGITATAGIGTNLYLAKIAMDIVAKRVKPDRDGVRIAELDERSYREKLWTHRPLTDFWRIGPGTARKLEANYIYTMGDIARASREKERWLYQLFQSAAEELIDHAWGYEPCTIAHIKKYRPKTNSLSSGQVLQNPYNFEKTRLIVREMTELVVLELVEKHLVTNLLTLTINYDRQNVDLGTVSGKPYTGKIRRDYYGRTVPCHSHGTANLGHYTSSTMQITNAMMRLFDRIADRDLWVRRITIDACNLAGADDNEPANVSSGAVCIGEQTSLFGVREEPSETERTTPEDHIHTLDREKHMQEAMVSLKKRFGKNAVLKGMNLEEGGTTIERNRQIGGHKA